MTTEELTALLYELGLRKISSPKKGNIQVCCPFHDDNNPSMGIMTDEPHIANCFHCGAFSLPTLVAHCKDFNIRGGKYDLKRAEDWLRERFNTTFRVESAKRRIDRYEERIDIPSRQDNIIQYPEYKIATFNSGEVTHSMFFSWGFTESTGVRFGVGFDRVFRRITVPIRDRQGRLCGCSGRATEDGEYIQIVKKITLLTKEGGYKRYKLRKHVPNPKYFNYWNYSKENLVFPADKFKLTKKLNYIILCEGVFDPMWLHQLGYTNALSILGSKISTQQIMMIRDLANEYGDVFSGEIVDMLDSDTPGRKGADRLYKMMHKDFKITKIQYPTFKSGKLKKDPRMCSAREIRKMLENRVMYTKTSIDRIR